MSEQTIQLPREGEKIGSGLVVSLIGVGGAAAVYKTWCESLELHRAVKVVHPDAGEEIRERMKTEARIASKLVHQNIVHVYNFGETTNGLPYLEMDFINGYTLAALIAKRGAMPLQVALAAAVGTLEGLHYAHTVNYTLYGIQHTGVMHRDIKPANVIVSTDTGFTRLMDFGIARPVMMSIHTMAETAPGTIAYMSPEVCTGGSCDMRSDIYQIGLLLYECISGHIAFGQTDLSSLLAAKSANTYKPLETDRRAAAIVNKCMQLDPAKRYQTALDCLDDIRKLYSTLCPGTAPEQLMKSYINGTPIPKAKIKRNYAKPLKFAAILTVCVLIALVVIAAGIRFAPQFLSAAAQTYATIQADTAAPIDSATTPAPEPPPQQTQLTKAQAIGQGTAKRATPTTGTAAPAKTVAAQAAMKEQPPKQ